MKYVPGTNEYSHIIRGDVYGIRYLGFSDVDYVFDIGANVGVFTLMARVLFPSAVLVAVEPNPKMLPLLKENMAELGVAIEEAAVGDGAPAKFGSRGHPLDSMIVDDSWKDSETITVPTIPLPELLKKHGCTNGSRYMMKINCEGGERFFIGNVASERALIGARHIGMMVHFRSPGTPFEHWPEFKTINDWVVRTFKRTHSIWYGNSDKRVGRGYYQLKRFDLPGTLDGVREFYQEDPRKLYQDVFFYKRSGRALSRSLWWGRGVIEVLGVETVVDFGCGLGGFLSGALSAGAKKVLGFDVGCDAAKFWMPRHVRPFVFYGNVGRPIDCGKWDCVLCVEVAEHLLPEEADVLVDNIDRAMGKYAVLAASPRRGYYHLNNQPYEYWVEKMRRRGLVLSAKKTEALKAKWREYRAPEYMVLNTMVFERENNG